MNITRIAFAVTALLLIALPAFAFLIKSRWTDVPA